MAAKLAECKVVDWDGDTAPPEKGWQINTAGNWALLGHHFGLSPYTERDRWLDLSGILEGDRKDMEWCYHPMKKVQTSTGSDGRNKCLRQLDVIRPVAPPLAQEQTKNDVASKGYNEFHSYRLLGNSTLLKTQYCGVWASTVLYREPSGSTLSATAPPNSALVLELWPSFPEPTNSGFYSLGTSPTAVRRVYKLGGVL